MTRRKAKPTPSRVPAAPRSELELFQEPAIIALDTPVWLAAMFGTTNALKPELLPVLEQAAQELRLVVSAASALQVARLVEEQQLPITDLPEWLDDTQRVPGVRVEPLTAQVIADASTLPPGAWSGMLAQDPLKRLVIATARRHASVFVTADPLLLAYAAAGHMVAFDARAS